MRELYNDIKHLLPIGLFPTPKVKEKVKAITRKVRLTKRNSLNELGAYLNGQNWEMVYDVNEIDDRVSAFTGTIQLILDKVLPKRTVRFHPSDKSWMTSRIKQGIKARQKAFTSGNKSRYKLLLTHISCNEKTLSAESRRCSWNPRG